MKIILIQDMEKLGAQGDTVTVKDGYARNYLIPRGFAWMATPGNLRALEEEKKQHAGRKQKEHGVHTREIAKRLLDFGFHAPTVYFPLVVDEAIMVEPTETESFEISFFVITRAESRRSSSWAMRCSSIACSFADEPRHDRRSFVVHPSGHFREPVMKCGEQAESHAAEDDIMEMAHDEVGIVQVDVGRKGAE